MQVEVVFARADRQALIRLELPAGATVRQAIEASDIASRFPDDALESCEVGVWGRIVERGHGLHDGDRVEIYRPLLIEPRETRRRLAELGQSMGAKADKKKVPGESG